MSLFLNLVQFPIRQRQKQVLKERKNVTKGDFVERLSTNSIEAAAASILWDLLADAAMIKNFKPLPDDNFLRLYGLAEEDLDEDIILRILRHLGLTPPDPSQLGQVGEISSPLELIKLVRLTAEGGGTLRQVTGLNSDWTSY